MVAGVCAMVLLSAKGKMQRCMHASPLRCSRQQPKRYRAAELTFCGPAGGLPRQQAQQ